VLQAAPQALILRTSWVYAATGQNFMRTMLGLFRQRSELQVVADQFGAPTPAAWVAATTLQLLMFGQSGVLNLSANGHCSWYQFAQAILTLARQHQVPGLQCQHIAAIATSAWPAPARRPLNSRLDLTAVQQICNQPMPDWQQGLQQTFLAWLALQPE
jgi:dTDP-4-dehydrorhamnose reductase